MPDFNWNKSMERAPGGHFVKSTETPAAMATRFWSKVILGGPDECWMWTGVRTGTRNGKVRYGQFSVNGKMIVAHRVAWELTHGPIPEGLLPDHQCREHGCVNPGHLELVTNQENILRGVGPTAVNAKKTHCIHGHRFNERNTIIRIRGGQRTRACRKCKNAEGRIYQAGKRKEAKRARLSQ